MVVKIEKSFQIQQPIEKVWSFLSDPQKVVTCVPGAQITEQLGEHSYKGGVSVKVGPSVSDYRGQVEIVRTDPREHEIEIVGKGQDTRGKGTASMKMVARLRALPEGGAEVVSISEISIAGILAQVGSRMINEVSNILFQQFVANLRQQLEQAAQPASVPPNDPPPGNAKPVSAIPLALAAFWAAIKRLFTGSRREV